MAFVIYDDATTTNTWNACVHALRHLDKGPNIILIIYRINQYPYIEFLGIFFSKFSKVVVASLRSNWFDIPHIWAACVCASNLFMMMVVAIFYSILFELSRILNCTCLCVCLKNIIFKCNENQKKSDGPFKHTHKLQCLMCATLFFFSFGSSGVLRRGRFLCKLSINPKQKLPTARAHQEYKRMHKSYMQASANDGQTKNYPVATPYHLWCGI